jgi:hypothetical protein
MTITSASILEGFEDAAAEAIEGATSIRETSTATATNCMLCIGYYLMLQGGAPLSRQRREPACLSPPVCGVFVYRAFRPFAAFVTVVTVT